MFKGYQIATYNVDLGTLKQSIRDIAAIGGNCVRFQMIAPDPRYTEVTSAQDFRLWTFYEYEYWWWTQIEKVRECLKVIIDENLDMQLVIDCHSPYGGAWGEVSLDGSKHVHLINLSDEEQATWAGSSGLVQEACREKLKGYYRRKFSALWLAAIKNLHDAGLEKAIAGFDLCNEPAAKSEKAWQRTARKLARIIRNFEKVKGYKTKRIFISSTGGHARRFRSMKPIDIPKVSMQAHFYYSGKLSTGRLIRELRPAFRYARKNRVPLYLGEIGCSRNNGDEYVADFFKTLLPILSKEKSVRRKGGGATIHAWNESIQFDYRSIEAGQVIEGWLG